MYAMLSIADDAPVLQTLQAHGSDVTSCDFGGNYFLASGSGDKTARVWEWSAGQGYVEAPYSPLAAHKYGVTCVRFSPRGTMLATASIDGCTILWNVRTGVRIHTFIQTSGGAVRVCRFSPDSTLLVAAGDDGSVCLWNLVRRNLVRTFQEHEGTVQTVAFTPDCAYLVTACTLGVMKLWSVAELADGGAGVSCRLSVDDAHDLGVVSSDFSPARHLAEEGDTGYLLATSGNDSEVKLWRLEVGPYDKCQGASPCELSLCASLEGHTSAVMCARFSPGGHYVASSGLDKTVRLWALDGTCVCVLEKHTRYVACCSFSRDGILLATGSNDRSLVVWDLSSSLTLDSELVKPCSALSHYGNNNKEGGAGLQEQEAATEGGEVKLLQRLDQHAGAVNSCHFSGSSLLASGASDKLVRVFARSEEGRFQEADCSPLEGHSYAVNKVEFSPAGGLLASCSMDGTSVVWDVQTGGRARPSFQCSGSGLRACRFSPDGHLLVTAGDDERASVWAVGTMELLMCVEGHSDAVVGAAFTPDSRLLATASSDGTARLWCVAPCSEACLLTQEEAHDLGAQSCDFSPAEGVASAGLRDRRYRYLLATCGNDSLVKLWRVTAVECVPWRSLLGHGGSVMCVRFSAVTGELLASTATDKTARLWNTYTGECVHVLEGHDSLVTACAFSGDSSLLATGSMDKSIILWELPQQLVFQSQAAGRLRGRSKKLLQWSAEDVSQWLAELDLPELAGRVRGANLTGHRLLALPPSEVAALLDAGDADVQRKLSLHLFWLKKGDADVLELPADVALPHEFLCPITHELMRDPVTCSDGFTYERAAINEWFMSGKFSSPMTNATLTDTSCAANVRLHAAICQFLYGEDEP
ncbi:WD repeat, SAM and U-box domain-containing protein 1-like [Bacillus rossius redtenbacheri]|uniref:WD repeat, SAM and U-box domain-containing protein 1-like n=1 Tax=Bacillus rossius redtenbacheri TaxID=93214 RepID=UPI002FDD7A68